MRKRKRKNSNPTKNVRHKPYKSPGKDQADLKMADAENIHSAVNDADLLLEANNGECDDALSDLSTIKCTSPPPPIRIRTHTT